MDELLKYEGVTFVKSVVKSMSKEAFVKAHNDVLWLDRDKPTRKKMLGRVYDLIAEKSEE
jgi:hypothetical protein